MERLLKATCPKIFIADHVYKATCSAASAEAIVAIKVPPPLGRQEYIDFIDLSGIGEKYGR